MFTPIAALLPVILWSIDEFTARSYAVVVVVWLLVSSEVFAPTSPETGWWRRLQWVKAVGWIVLTYIVSERIAIIL